MHEQPPVSVERSTTKARGHDIVLAEYCDTRFYRLYIMLINPDKDWGVDLLFTSVALPLQQDDTFKLQIIIK